VLPGVRARIGAIRVHNEPLPGAPQRLGDATVRRLLGVSVGDEYNEHELADAQRELYQSDLFRHVEVGLAPDSAQGTVDSLVTVDVSLRENFVRQLDTEVGWAVLDCFKGRALLVDKNFLGEARRLELTAQLSKLGHAENTRFADGKLCASDMSNDPFSSSEAPAPTFTMAELSAIVLDTFCLAPVATTDGEMAIEVADVPEFAVTTNCCSTPVLTLVSGCTRNTPAKVITSPTRNEVVPVSTVMVAPDCVAPFDR
jgi:hypothetical protein